MPYYAAPSLARFEETSIVINCPARLLRAVWKAQTVEEVARALPGRRGLPDLPLKSLKMRVIAEEAGLEQPKLIGHLETKQGTYRTRLEIWACPQRHEDTQTLVFIGRSMAINTLGYYRFKGISRR